MSSDATPSEEMSPDVVFEILSNTRRRMVLYYLRQYGGTASVQELAEQIAALENDVAVDDLERQQRKRVYVSLYQTHLPKLEDTGIISYDDDRGRVQLTNRAMEIDTYLTPSSDETYPWQLHYLVLALAGGILFALSFLDVPVIAGLSPAVIGIVLITGFALSASIQYWRHRRRKSELPSELVEHDW